MAIQPAAFADLLERSKAERREDVRQVVRANHAVMFHKGAGRSGAHLKLNVRSAFAVANAFLDQAELELAAAIAQPGAKVEALSAAVRVSVLGFADELWELTDSKAVPREGAVKDALARMHADCRRSLELRLEKGEGGLRGARPSGIRKLIVDHPWLGSSVSFALGVAATKLIEALVAGPLKLVAGWLPR